MSWNKYGERIQNYPEGKSEIGRSDEVTTERTLEAMDYNIKVKQQFIDSLLKELVDLQEENKRQREEIVFLEHLRQTSIN